MKTVDNEPTIAVGLMIGVEDVWFRLNGEFISANGQRFAPGNYQAVKHRDALQIRDANGRRILTGPMLDLLPTDPAAAVFSLAGITIGIDFHWQRQEEQTFQGTLSLSARSGQGLTVTNKIPLERYLNSVICSEMSASCPGEFLKAHAIISRSWLLAQRQRQTSELRPQSATANHEPQTTDREIIRWTSRENHTEFDVCADDHCQRYQGIGKATSAAVFEAVRETRGKVLTSADGICDARFSKCCGGMTENYRAAWEDRDVPYLTAIYDGPPAAHDFSFPLGREENAERWITGSPPVYCNTADETLLEQILPDADQQTTDFFRWEIAYSQQELRALIEQKLNVDLGAIRALEPVLRGVSGRLIKLRIIGERGSMVVGKELEIRRALSPSHLYSSAFVARPEGDKTAPQGFRLLGAGWGHGVGLCQIGAAVMAREGKSYQEILAHYYRGSWLQVLY